MRDLTTFMSILACPFCGQSFEQVQTMLRCAQGHSFDLAREGYVYFLRKPLPGDTKEMLLARRAIFEQGMYEPLSNMLNTAIAAHLQAEHDAGSVRLFDAGCGEGYYLARLYDALLTPERSVISLGCDISKEAIRLAARRYPLSFFQVANIKDRLPLANNTLDVLLNIFAPRNTVEFARTLSPGGLLVVAIPGPQHILELRSALQLLAIEEQKEQHVIAQFTTPAEATTAPFTLLACEQITYTRTLHQDEITRVVMMTPNFWHLTETQRSQMAALETLETSFDFRCLLFRKVPQ